MKPASAKSKGRKHQQRLAELIVAAFEELSEDDVVSRPMGSGGVDLMMSPLAQRLFPISIEAKATKTKPGLKALQQAKYNAYPGTSGAVAWKPPGQPSTETIVMIHIQDLIDLMARGRFE